MSVLVYPPRDSAVNCGWRKESSVFVENHVLDLVISLCRYGVCTAINATLIKMLKADCGVEIKERTLQDYLIRLKHRGLITVEGGRRAKRLIRLSSKPAPKAPKTRANPDGHYDCKIDSKNNTQRNPAAPVKSASSPAVDSHRMSGCTDSPTDKPKTVEYSTVLEKLIGFGVWRSRAIEALDTLPTAYIRSILAAVTCRGHKVIKAAPYIGKAISDALAGKPWVWEEDELLERKRLELAAKQERNRLQAIKDHTAQQAKDAINAKMDALIAALPLIKRQEIEDKAMAMILPTWRCKPTVLRTQMPNHRRNVYQEIYGVVQF